MSTIVGAYLTKNTPTPAALYAVGCLHCGAQPGEWCRMVDRIWREKTWTGNPHMVRRLLAGEVA